MQKTDEWQVTRYIAGFALPLIAGSILQQLYNAVDAMIVGRFLGEASLGIGMNVLFAMKWGSGDRKAFRITTGTALTTGCLFSLALAAVCILNARWILRFCNCPEEILGDSLIYLKIVEAGLIFTFLYNFYSAVFLAVGDSRVPFFSLMVSAVINIGLDLLFVAYLRLGTGGAAAATVLSRYVEVAIVIAWTHTHAEQQPFVQGLYRVGGLALYVSSGCAQWAGFSARFFVPTEIAVLTFRARKEDSPERAAPPLP